MAGLGVDESSVALSPWDELGAGSAGKVSGSWFGSIGFEFSKFHFQCATGLKDFIVTFIVVADRKSVV